MTNTTQNMISASILRLRMKSPFFATLAMFAQFKADPTCPTAATNGKDIFYNEDYIRSLPPKQVDGLILHEVLHAALLHCTRRSTRDAMVWNIAADIVINGMIAQELNFELPIGGIRDPELEDYTVEEVYELLLKRSKLPTLDNLDVLSPSYTSGNQPATPDNQLQIPLTAAEKAQLESHWHSALQQAKIIAQSTQKGNLPARILRELDRLTTPQIDWRSYLWRYLTQTPNDFDAFDRRFIGQGLYLETLSGESIKVAVAIDTSGSIDSELLRIFLSEMQGILNAYPHLTCDLYYADTDVYGPYNLDPNRSLPCPEGGGGTSFVPFFEAITRSGDCQTPSLAIYLTDGYGDFPAIFPAIPILWVVTAGGLDLAAFPFGETVRLLSVD
jgi:predicted metal-dependent peptidase